VRSLEHEVAEHIAFLERELAPREHQQALAWWNLATTGKEEYQEEYARLDVDITRLLNQPPVFAQVRSWYHQRHHIQDEMLRRQLEIMYLTYASRQRDPEDVERISHLEAELESAYSNFRATVRGRQLTDNQIMEILKRERDDALRREAWEASKQVGSQVAERVLTLVELRNKSARRLGYRDYYAKELELQEIDEGSLFDILRRLEDLTREPFRAAKAALDAQLAQRFGIAVSDLRPWHYADPFFQEAPPLDLDLDHLFANAPVEKLTVQTYAGMGLDVQDILARSDLYERPGKNQHAFCVHIDRRTDDVRVLANLRPDRRWMMTSLHEYGHGIYDKYLATDLPYLLRTPAHTNSTEAIAMLMGRLTEDPEWLHRVLGLPKDTVVDITPKLRAYQRLAMLIFARWGLVMVHFERDLYADPRRPDLNSLWWDYVERFQMVTRPEGRNAPDWAAKLHLALAPVYYHNYILGELTASQIHHYITTQLPGGHMVHNPAVGAFLRDHLFALGARYPWNETLRRATGEPLNPAYFVQQFVAT